jgi:DNA-binding MarR family transcriptional regulator
VYIAYFAVIEVGATRWGSFVSMERKKRMTSGKSVVGKSRVVRDSAPTASVGGLSEYKFAQQVGHLLRRAYQRHTAIFQRLCPDPQLTSVQLAVLCAVGERDACSLSEIGRAAAIDPATTRGIVERLEQRRLITLLADETDKRKVMVVLELAGQRLLKDVLPHAQQITQQTTCALNPAEEIALGFLLRKLVETNIDDFDSAAG